jgi:hypothetical protein
MLLPMVDGGILSVDYDSESYGGCDTCDYGSSYIRKFDIGLTTINIHIETEEMYDYAISEYAISEDFMMRMFLHNVDKIRQMTELEFYEWLVAIVRDEVGSSLDSFYYNEV